MSTRSPGSPAPIRVNIAEALENPPGIPSPRPAPARVQVPPTPANGHAGFDTSSTRLTPQGPRLRLAETLPPPVIPHGHVLGRIPDYDVVIVDDVDSTEVLEEVDANPLDVEDLPAAGFAIIGVDEIEELTDDPPTDKSELGAFQTQIAYTLHQIHDPQQIQQQLFSLVLRELQSFKTAMTEPPPQRAHLAEIFNKKIMFVADHLVGKLRLTPHPDFLSLLDWSRWAANRLELNPSAKLEPFPTYNSRLIF